MKPEQQVPRNALVWIIISLFTLVAPHAARIPFGCWWSTCLQRSGASWCIGAAGLSRALGKSGTDVSGFAGIYFSYGSLMGLEPTVALLLTAFALKLIELAGARTPMCCFSSATLFVSPSFCSARIC